jgi:hypothetical protein
MSRRKRKKERKHFTTLDKFKVKSAWLSIPQGCAPENLENEMEWRGKRWKGMEW